MRSASASAPPAERPRRVAVFGNANLEIVIPAGPFPIPYQPDRLTAGEITVGVSGTAYGERLILNDHRGNGPWQHDPAQAARIARGCDLAVIPFGPASTRLAEHAAGLGLPGGAQGCSPRSSSTPPRPGATGRAAQNLEAWPAQSPAHGASFALSAAMSASILLRESSRWARTRARTPVALRSRTASAIAVCSCLARAPSPG